MCQPARYSGFEMSWDVLCDVAEVLAPACGSQAWLQHIFADHTVLVATFPAQAQEDVWGKDHNTIVSASFDPAGRAKRVEGGFMYSGRHGFASGIDFAGWLVCCGMIVENEGLDGPHFFLVPKSDAEVIDDWQVMALEGTGSKTFVVTDKFIPAHRFLDGRLCARRHRSGTAVTRRRSIGCRGSPAWPRPGSRRSRSAWRAACWRSGSPYRAAQVARGGGRRAAEHAGAGGALRGRDRCGACAQSGHGARRHAQARGGRDAERRRRLTGRRNVAFAAQLALRAGTRLFNAAGGHAVYLKGAMQRQFRNLLGAAAHRGVTWDPSAADYGAALLEQHGAPRQSPTLGAISDSTKIVCTVAQALTPPCNEMVSSVEPARHRTIRAQARGGKSARCRTSRIGNGGRPDRGDDDVAGQTVAAIAPNRETEIRGTRFPRRPARRP